MNTSNTGSTTPLINWAVSMIFIRLRPGISTTIAENTMTEVKMPLNMGASFHVKSTPASQPNASQITNDVVSGSTHAARKLAAVRPAANRICAYSPANGASAVAASCAESIEMPCG